jgi:hypothetical protein
MEKIVLAINLNDKEDGKRVMSILRKKKHPHYMGDNKHRSCYRNIKGGLKMFRT